MGFGVRKTTWYCAKCGVLKTKENTNLSKDKLSGFLSYCKNCHNKWRKELTMNYSEEKKEQIKEQERNHKRERYSDNPMYISLLSKKTFSKKYNLPFNLTLEDLIVPEYCPLLNVKMERGTPYTPSIDRIIPSLGYVKGNIQIVSLKANLMKTNATLKELKSFCENAPKLYELDKIED